MNAPRVEGVVKAEPFLHAAPNVTENPPDNAEHNGRPWGNKPSKTKFFSNRDQVSFKFLEYHWFMVFIFFFVH